MPKKFPPTPFNPARDDMGALLRPGHLVATRADDDTFVLAQVLARIPQGSPLGRRLPWPAVILRLQAGGLALRPSRLTHRLNLPAGACL